MTSKLLDLQELCGYLGVAYGGRAIRRVRSDPGFPDPVRVGGRDKWIRKEVDGYLLAKRDEIMRRYRAD